MTRVRFAVLDQKAGSADPESPDAAMEFPYCSIPCDGFFFVPAVVAAACDLSFAQARASMRERVRSGTQLDGTVVACCCLVLSAVVVYLWLVVLLFL